MDSKEEKNKIQEQPVVKEVISDNDKAFKSSKNLTDLEKEVQLRVGIIGIGNAGNKIAKAAYDEGFKRVLLVNSSLKDISEDAIGEIPCSIIGDGRGCGKDRSISKEFLKDSINEILLSNHYQTIVADSDIIVITFATAGGTGSGAGPMLAYATQSSYSGKLVIAIGIIPKYEESATAQYNTVDCSTELEKLNIPYTFIDLEKADGNNIRVNESAKEKFIEIIKVVRGNYFPKSDSVMIDERDTLTIFSEPGYFTTTIVKNISQESIIKGDYQDLIIESMDTNLHASAQRDKKIGYIGIGISLPRKILSMISSSEKFDKLCSYIGGKPKDIFMNYGILNNGTAGYFVCICSGMSFPIDRINKCISIAKEAKDELFNSENQVDELSEIDSAKDDLKWFVTPSEQKKNRILNTSNTTKNSSTNVSFPDFLN